MGSRGARVIRGVLASAVAIFVAALFHVAGGGAVPGVVPLGLSLAFASLASIALTARRLSLWRLTGAVGLSQLLFHLLFSLGSGTATFAPAAGGMTGHLHPGDHLVMTAGAMPAGAMPAGAMPAGHGDPTLSMWAAHLAAVLVTVVALRFGERAFWGLLETARIHVARFAERVTAVPVAVQTASVVAPVARPVRMRDLGIPLGRLRHRGPPLVAGVF